MVLTKTGAVVCKKPDAMNAMVYEALAFITGVPDNITDEYLKAQINPDNLNLNISGCSEIFFRADIHSTSNEVQEQFEHLHPADNPVPEISFDSILKNDSNGGSN